MTHELIPAHTQLLLPLLEELKAQGGQARPRDLYDGVAERVGLEPEARRATVPVGHQDVNLFERRVRWVRQTAVVAGLVCTPERGLWSLTQMGVAKLPRIRRGTVVTVLETADGNGFLFWAWAEDTVAVIEAESVDLIWSSPPYPLNRDIKGYGTSGTRQWVDGMLRLCERWRGLMAPTGSLMLDLGYVYQAGLPAHDLYVERFAVGMEDQLGLKLCQHLYWQNPNRLPTPIKWAAIDRTRLRTTVEPILWFSASPHRVNADNRRVLRPYTKSGLRAMRQPANQAGQRPSGYQLGRKSFARDNGGSIPGDVITAAGNQGNAYYYKAERDAGHRPGRAVVAEAVARFCIQFATERGDLVYDPFCGAPRSAVWQYPN